MAKDIYENIDDVKCSLDNAQRSFRKNNGLRGELDLMLAEASIRYLREKRGFASVWNRQKLAAALAVLLVLAGYGGWWYAGITERKNLRLCRALLCSRLNRRCSRQARQIKPGRRMQLRQRNLLSQI